MKREKRPWMLLYLLVGVLVLSTGLNFYFLLQLDNRVWDQEMQAELQEHVTDAQSVTLRRPAAPLGLPDTAAAPQP
jgi:Tfp pilus assembly protein PilO